MATEIRVPTLGESVSEATIGRWFKKPGDAVKADEPLVELETDKVTLEVNAPASGTLGDILAKDGETVAPGAVLGSITEGGAAAAPAAAASAAPTPKAETSKAEAPKAAAPAPRFSREGRRTTARPWAASQRKAASIPPRSPGPAKMAASPKATCWRRSPPGELRLRARSARTGPCAVVGR